MMPSKLMVKRTIPPETIIRTPPINFLFSIRLAAMPTMEKMIATMAEMRIPMPMPPNAVKKVPITATSRPARTPKKPPAKPNQNDLCIFEAPDYQEELEPNPIITIARLWETLIHSPCWMLAAGKRE